jgi:hypothetical protein
MAGAGMNNLNVAGTTKARIGIAGRTAGKRGFLKIVNEPREEKQQRQSNGSNAVGPNRTTACRPREHQDFEEWHELIGPKYCCQSDCQT